MCEHARALSSITDKDYVEIVSTFITQTNPKYRCMDCKKRYWSDPDKKTQQRKFMACNYMSKKPRHNYMPTHANAGNPKIDYFNCVGNHYYSRWASIINYYPRWKQGILPFSGGLMDQPSKFVEVMDLVHNLIRENEDEIKSKKQLSKR